MSNKLDKLREKQKAITEQIRREENRMNATKRKEETRRKILAGAAVLSEAEKDDGYKSGLYELLGKFLTRPEDRALFGLAPLPDKEPGSP